MTLVTTPWGRATVVEEAVLEEEQRAQEKAQDKRGVRKQRPKP